MSIEVIIIAVMAVIIVVLIAILGIALAKGTQEMERLEALPHELTPEDLHKLAVAAQDHKVKEYYRRLAADRARFFRAVRDIGEL